jgi:glycosyltransferase involved in cell wall biosynthesis
VGIELPKITFLLMNAFTVGGTIRTTFTMADELAKRGHDVEIVSVYRMRQSAPQLPVPQGVRLRTLTDLRAPTLERLAAGRDPVSRLRHWLLGRRSRLITSNESRYKNFNLLTDVNLLRFLASLRDGIVIATRPGLNLATAALVPRQVIRIGQDHLNLAVYKPGLLQQMRRFYPRLDMLTALTPGTADGYRRLLDGRVSVECFPNAVPDVGGHLAEYDAKLVVAAGRLTRQKGFDRLLSVWPRVAERHPDWELRIFGWGPEEESLQRQIDELDIGDSAKLAGFTRRLHEEFSRASLFVMTSRHEGFPMVLIEAMGVGLPAVSVDCETGPRDIISNGVDGYVVPEDDPDALASAMRELMADVDKRRVVGAAARGVAQRYNAGELAARWEQTLAAIVAGKGRARETIVLRALALVVGQFARRALRFVKRRTAGIAGAARPRASASIR